MARVSYKLLVLAFAALGLVAVAGACGTDAVGVDACRQIESARCVQAPNCSGINLGVPIHRDSPKTDVDACIRYYQDACLHGLEVAKDPGAVAVKACVDAINTGDCAVVTNPETHPACLWLVPPAPPVDVDAAADAADATDGSDAADATGQ